MSTLVLKYFEELRVYLENKDRREGVARAFTHWYWGEFHKILFKRPNLCSKKHFLKTLGWETHRYFTAAVAILMRKYER